ncbi:hypothetical protein ACGFNU_01880 [Spirillospora sp. NPDC048911]|uniref:hypothetical protein n=1 Tax=Spirillospora sp. NPDC048911 TaxID=3364527 RepID=UPI003722D54D
MGTVRTDLRWHGAKVKGAERAAAVRGLRLAAEHLLEESRRLVPIQSGDLARSGVASVDAARLTAAVSYDTPYAVRQHEELNFRHDPGRSAKYLEIPATTEAGEIARRLQEELRRAL